MTMFLKPLPPSAPQRARGWLRCMWALVRAHRLAFAVSTLAGSVAAAAPYLLLSFMFAVLGLLRDITVASNWLNALAFALLPLSVSLPLVLLGMVCIVLPLSVWLLPRGWRGGCALVVLATLGGALLTGVWLAVLQTRDAEWLLGMGAFSGAVASLCWWGMLAVQARDARHG